jgi:ankyrin repeat protein
MRTTDLTPLPERPSLEQYKKQAKDLLKAAKLTPASAEWTLAAAQLAIAREHGFESWPKFALHVKELTRLSSPISNFEAAADAIVAGDVTKLTVLLSEHPDLVRARSARGHQATLLQYIGANGVEDYRQKSPANAVDIASVLLKAGAEVDAAAPIYGEDTALGLVATSGHPQRAGVQLALMELLLSYGAAIDGIAGQRSILIAALHNGRKEAAEFLAGRGARLDLEGAAGLGRLDIVASFFDEAGGLKPSATTSQMELGFLWACEYGRNDVVEFLLERGVELDAQQNTGLTGLHWAIVGAQLETVKLLLSRGASLEARNRYGGTALGQALWCRSTSDGFDYNPIVEMLIQAGGCE